MSEDNRRFVINIGDKIGCLTIKGYASNFRKSPSAYKVVCDCGKESIRGQNRFDRLKKPIEFCSKDCGLMDLTGRIINGVEVIRLENPEKSSSRYICKCVCGELMVKESVRIREGAHLHCSSACGQMFENIGTKYTHCEIVWVKNIDGKMFYECKCECGKIFYSNKFELENIRSHCGCLTSIKRSISAQKHGLYKTRIYGIFTDMKARCYNKSSAEYKNYGGRGIDICEQWMDKDFGALNFYIWAVNNGCKDDLTIDRIDVNKGYSPDNCRWVDNITQQNNRTDNHYICFCGERKSIADWSRKTGVPAYSIQYRITHGWDVERALYEPVNAIKHGGV